MSRVSKDSGKTVIYSNALMKSAVRLATTLPEMCYQFIYRTAVGEGQVKRHPDWSVNFAETWNSLAFVSHMKPIRSLCGSPCAPLMLMWGSLEIFQGVLEDHLCTCNAHDFCVQPTAWEEYRIGWRLCTNLSPCLPAQEVCTAVQGNLLKNNQK